MPLERKKRSEEFLQRNGITVNESLPPIISENEADIKSAEKIMKRAVTSFLASLIALEIISGESAGKTASLFLQFLNAFGLDEEATEDEKKLFSLGLKLLPKKPPASFLEVMSQRFERSLPLFWSCGLLGENDLPYPSGISNDEVQKISDIISKCEHFGRVMASVNMHTLAEILENADQAYRMYSACREALENGEKPPAHLAAGVLMEQVRGFNWLLGEYGRDDWDNISDNILEARG